MIPDDLVRRYSPDDRARPLLRANFVTSVDGAVTVDGLSGGLSGPADKRVFGVLRMLADAVLVGAGTLRREEYRPILLSEERRAWRVAHGLTAYPTLVVVSASLALSDSLPAIGSSPVPPLILTPTTAPEPPADLTATVLRFRHLADGLAQLHGRGLRQILCEGGPVLLGALIAEDLVDELCLTVSPLLAGPGAGRIAGGPAARRSMTLRSHSITDGMLMLRYSRSN